MDIQERIDRYWSLRADEFSDARLADLKEYKHERWKRVIQEALPAKKQIRALDLGTGAGFFALILNELGCEVAGIDYSQQMISNAKKNAELLHCCPVSFLQMDAQCLDFPEGAFDFIFTRNVTWTLPDPQKAYSEMVRVLSPGGRLMNCDSNYGAAFREADRTGETERSARKDMDGLYSYPAQSLGMLRERNDIADSLSISDCIRPQWDVDVLLRLGIREIKIDSDINRRIIPETEEGGREKLWLSSTPLFMVLAEK